VASSASDTRNVFGEYFRPPIDVSILSDVFVFFPLVIKDRRSTDERRKISIVGATLLFLIKDRVRGDGDLALGATVTRVATIPSRR